jgi:hypothetical protein
MAPVCTAVMADGKAMGCRWPRQPIECPTVSIVRSLA